MDAKQIQQEIYADLARSDERKGEKRAKKSFWPTDFGRTLNELFWAWTHVPKTNPTSPEKLSMFKIAKLCELHTITQLQRIGFAANLDNEEHLAQVKELLGDKYIEHTQRDEFGQRQMRIEMEREYVPITGYMDGITLNGEPIECKSSRSSYLFKEIGLGMEIRNDNYIGQLATYMDYLGKKVGWLVFTHRGDGVIMVVKVEHLGNGIYSTTQHSLGAPEEMEAPPLPVDFELTPTVVDLHEQYKRWRTLFEEHIHPNIEPPLEFEYKPTITDELLEGYLGEPNDEGKRDDKTIRAAIKGNRILSDHEWFPQYCDWKDLWVATECMQKGFGEDIKTFLKYQRYELEHMLEFIDAIYINDRIVKATPSAVAKLRRMDLDAWRKKNFQSIARERNQAGVANSAPLKDMDGISAKQAELFAKYTLEKASDLDRVTDDELLSFKGIGAVLVAKIRQATHTFIPNELVADMNNHPIRRYRNELTKK